MLTPPERKTARSGPADTRRGSGGGPAGGGGYNFQAAATAIAMAHAANAKPLGWLTGLAHDVPLHVSVETGGGGDDLRIRLAEDRVVEGQVKRGLTAGKPFETAMDRLAAAVQRKEITYGLLIVDHAASRTISRDFARDVEAIGEGRFDDLRVHAKAFVSRLRAAEIEPVAICARLRVITLHALREDEADVRVATSELSHVCDTPSAGAAAWRVLYADAHIMVERRGARSRADIARTLRAGGIALGGTGSAPAIVADRICRWVAKVNATFSIVGVREPLPIETAWISLPLVVSAGEPDDLDSRDLETAIARYHTAGASRPAARQDGCEATTLGRFRRLAVVVAGPGMGKTLLLRRLAMAYAADGHPVLRVRALDVARRMVKSGDAFEEAVFAHGLAESGVSPAEARAAGLGNWVILVDGLDECGAHQAKVTEAMARFASGWPGCRIVATTRPVGYRRLHTSAWRHYKIAGLPNGDASSYLADLLGHILPPSDARRPVLRSYVEELLEASHARSTAERSPLLLALCAALIARGDTLGSTRLDFYRAIFRMIEETGALRGVPPPLAPTVLTRVLDTMAWTLLREPTLMRDAALRHSAVALAPDLGVPALRAQEIVETSLEYWEQLGVVERLSHRGDEALTFVHLTFAEFAAGRFLAGASLEDQRAVLRDQSHLARFSEAIAFAAALGAGHVFLGDIVAQGFVGVAGQARLERALEVLAESEPFPDPALATAVFDAAFDYVIGSHATWAIEAGAGLARCAPRAATSLAERAGNLLNHPQRWSRLAGWAIWLAARPEPDVADLRSALAAYKELARRPERKTGGGGIVALSSNPRERSLRERLGYRLAERAAETMPASEADAALAETFSEETASSIGLLIRLERLVARHSLAFRPSAPLARLGAGMNSGLNADHIKRGMEATHQGYLNLMRYLAAPADGFEGEIEPPSNAAGPFYLLGAMFEIFDVGGTTLQDFLALRTPAEESDVRQVIVALADAAGLPRDRLAQEAQAHYRRSAAADPGSVSAMFDGLPTPDLPPLEWTHAMRATLDMGAVGRLLAHPATLLVGGALTVALGLATPEDRRSLAGMLLERENEEGIHAAVQLATGLPATEAADLLLRATAHISGRGGRHLYSGLAALGVGADPRRLAALKKALLGVEPYTADSAAVWMRRSQHPDQDEEAHILLKAWEHWKVTEKPYPKGGGTVPPSPREEILRALDAVGALQAELLFRALSDPRSDVAGAARELVLARAAISADARARLVTAILDRSAPAQLVTDALQGEIKFGAEEVERLLALLEDEDVARRHPAMALLDTEHIGADVRLHHLARLRHDPANSVRETAVRMIG